MDPAGSGFFGCLPVIAVMMANLLIYRGVKGPFWYCQLCCVILYFGLFLIWRFNG